MELNDIVNSLFELGGALLTWLNVKKLLRDKDIKGVFWPIWIFFTSWGFWNLYYYPSVGHLLSFWAGVLLVAGNTTWVVIAWYYMSHMKRKM